MLIQMLAGRPEMLAPILKNTPTWVWGLLAVVIALGLSQVKARVAGLGRIATLPAAMTLVSILGMLWAFRASALIGYAVLAWLCAGAAMAVLVARGAADRGTTYESASRRFAVPGSWVPLALIMGIFLTRYVVGVELAMQPGLARDGQYAMVVAALYGSFSGIFIGRAARLWRLAYRPECRPAPALQARP